MRNPYLANNNDFHLINSVVVFIDILGYLGIVENSRNQGTEHGLLRSLHSTLTSINNYLIDNSDSGFMYKNFTDNIVIGWPILEDGEHELGSIFNMISFIQLEMIRSNFFIRGGISVGDIYIDEVVVFGNALNESYNAEVNLARDPRIVLANSAQNLVNNHLNYYPNRNRSPQNQSLLLDSDGQYFINYLDVIVENDIESFTEVLIQHRDVITTNLEVYASSPLIWNKYQWCATYHNYFCELYSNHFDDGFKIDQRLIRLNPSRIVE